MEPLSLKGQTIEIVPAILKKTREKIAEDWDKIEAAAAHVQIDITDGVFAGDGTFRELRWFKKLKNSEKIEIHLMAHHPGYYVEDIIDLLPARCVFHLETFTGRDDLENVFNRLKEKTQTELGLAINPSTPSERLDEYRDLLNYVMFLGYEPGRANQPIDSTVFRKIGAFRDRDPGIRIAVDGHVDKGTVENYVKAGARILCANTSIFGEGNPVENLRQLELLAQAAVSQ